MAFSVLLNFCSAERLSSALQLRTEHILPAQEEQSRARLQSVITGLSLAHVLLQNNNPRQCRWTDWIPVLNRVLEAAFPVLRAAPTITHAEQHHIVAHIPLEKPPARDNYISNYYRIYLEYYQAKQWSIIICLTWKKYALSTGSFSRLCTSAMNVDSVVFTSASLYCHRQDSRHLRVMIICF